jgi:hypothetical protein
MWILLAGAVTRKPYVLGSEPQVVEKSMAELQIF